MKHLKIYLVVIVICTCLFFRCESRYLPCSIKKSGIIKETRRLFIATCETRKDLKALRDERFWNETSLALKRDKIPMVNLCSNVTWQSLLDKPFHYYEYAKSIAQQYPDKLSHMLLMDSDTYWSIDDVSTLWSKYDCVRGNKSIVISTEMNCWTGRFCTQEDIDRLYRHVNETDSYSPYINTGVIMGQAESIAKMLHYVLVNNESYYVRFSSSRKHQPHFNDQFAIPDYVANVGSEDVALDIHQEFSSPFSLHTQIRDGGRGRGFVCKSSHTGYTSTKCEDYANVLKHHGHYVINNTTCILSKHIWDGMPYQIEAETLAPNPIIWHGNGEAKANFLEYGEKIMNCLNELNPTLIFENVRW